MDLQDLILGLFFVEVTIELEISLFFLFGWRKGEKERKWSIVAVLGLYFLFLAIGRIILIIHDFHIEEPVFYFMGIGFSLLGMLLFIFIAEYIIPLNTRYIFTLLGIGTLISIFFFEKATAQFIMYLTIPIIFIMGFAFITFLIHRTSGKVRNYFIIIFIGQFIYGIGTGLNTDFVWGLFYAANIEIRPIGLLCIVGGLALIAFAFWRLPSFTEIEWHSKMLNLYVITKDHGICCLYYPFQEQKGGLGPQLISGGVTGIIGLIKEMTSSKKHLKAMDHEDIEIIFEYGLYTTTALIVEEDLQIYHDKLKKFVEEFEDTYKQKFIDWTGAVAEFESAVDIVGRIFEQKNIPAKISGNEDICGEDA
ncbi:MAG: hypothetical protein HWN66_20020 [Candidatus Helarchaeota archaeon]|nr:hypothetical protein [Candidatus Helarchaeota archaeon]